MSFSLNPFYSLLLRYNRSEGLVSCNAIAGFMASIQSTNHAFERFRHRILPLLGLAFKNQLSNLGNFNQFILNNLNTQVQIFQNSDPNIKKMTTVLMAQGFEIPLTLVIDTKTKRILTIYTTRELERTAHRMNTVWRCLC